MLQLMAKPGSSAAAVNLVKVVPGVTVATALQVIPPLPGVTVATAEKVGSAGLSQALAGQVAMAVTVLSALAVLPATGVTVATEHQAAQAARAAPEVTLKQQQVTVARVEQAGQQVTVGQRVTVDQAQMRQVVMQHRLEETAVLEPQAGSVALVELAETRLGSAPTEMVVKADQVATPAGLAPVAQVVTETQIMCMAATVVTVKAQARQVSAVSAV